MTFDTFGEVGDQLMKRVERIIATEAILFESAIQKRWAVDTGTSRRAWIHKQITPQHHEVTNDVSYSPYIWTANRPSVKNGSNLAWWHGSGGEPIYKKVRNRMQRRLNAIV